MAGPRQKPIYAFIDSQNLNLGTQSQGWKLDFTRFRNLLSDRYKVQKAFLFIGFISKYQPLYESLAKAGYSLILKPTVTHKIKGAHETKGNVDAELVLHAMIQFPHYSKAIIVSGDGDFHCLIEYLKSKNKLAKILVPNHKYSSLLRKFASLITPLQLFRPKIQLSIIKTKRRTFARDKTLR
ncbi:MAG: NYN domain-containing protein [Microgenomates group bacterium]